MSNMVKNTDKKNSIKNPQRIVLRKWLITDAFLIILGLHSILNFDINSFDGMFIMVSITIVITSLFFLKSTLKNIKALDNAIKNRVMIAHWKYTKKEWQDYLNFEEKYRYDQGKLIAWVLFTITTFVFVPFILIIKEGKFFMFLVMIGLYILYFIMGWIFPTILFNYKRRRSIGEVILLENGVLLNKQFHTWDFPLSKLNSVKLVEEPYKHLVIDYNFFDRTGPRSYAINVPIPKNNKQNLKKIISKFK